jgi:peptidoglycan hydrolase-like protein with peptidoglycan-binding domain
LRIAAFLGVFCLLPFGAPAKTVTHKKRPSTKTAATSTKHAKTTTRRTKKSRTKAAQSWRSRQLAPTPERYREIQGALASRGYLKSAPTGAWNAESAEALRQFQHDQNLEPSGKVNSLSLIALGLGAKHGSAVVPPGVPRQAEPGRPLATPNPAAPVVAPQPPTPTPLPPDR